MRAGTPSVQSVAQCYQNGRGVARRPYGLFKKEGASNGWYETITRTGVHAMLERQYYRSIDKVFLFSSSFIHQSTKYERKEPLATVRTGYRKVSDMTEFMEQRS